MTKTIYDLHKIDEDERIRMIGEVASAGKIVGALIDDEDEKVKRYIKKVTERYPNVIVIEQFKGPTKGVVTVKFGPLQS